MATKKRKTTTLRNSKIARVFPNDVVNDERVRMRPLKGKTPALKGGTSSLFGSWVILIGTGAKFSKEGGLGQ